MVTRVCYGVVCDFGFISHILRQMHVVDLETSTLCLVGARNVGKSSLVGILSTRKPEITQHKWSWPFMTPVDVQKLGLQDYHQPAQLHQE
ncbi:uncharacterized protein LOC126797448 isoform X2 [Argentina anserina]|uniref:uncharacterized protein LOC126797448 isoform X2 n=1 Tax=Argentina anserina TaxID=57926 RepID=UPI0021767C75|nr:uncharacterized protein LOC126797448 isoform X2 [Potentilla anserina]